ncbi:hypothetical protein AAHK20_05955 [Trinickia sp. YCB016]
MSANELLSRMLRYQAWAHDEILGAATGLDAEHLHRTEPERRLQGRVEVTGANA